MSIWQWGKCLALYLFFVSGATLLADCRRQSEAKLVLRTASQNESVFLTWNSIPDAQHYFVQWREAGHDTWEHSLETKNPQYLIQNLTNDIEYEFLLAAQVRLNAKPRQSIKRVQSEIVTQVPRIRNTSYPHYSHFDSRLSLFLSQQAMTDWLFSTSLSFNPLVLRGSFISVLDINAPNGIYSTPDRSETMVLLRSVDDRYSPAPSVKSPELVRDLLRRALWPRKNPFNNPDKFPFSIEKVNDPLVGDVTGFHSARSFVIKYHPLLASRITYFRSAKSRSNRVAIYTEGHGGSAVQIAVGTIEKLLSDGWDVISVDMPLFGMNQIDMSAELTNHGDFDKLDTGENSPVGLFFLPLKIVVDSICGKGSCRDIYLMTIGLSGGGWTSLMYGALDPRVDVVVSMAGATPQSQRLSASSGPYEVGDYEQFAPQVLQVLDYDDIMIAAGSKGALYGYNQHDPCCFAVGENDPFVQHLRNSGDIVRKPIEVFIDKENTTHSMSNAFLDELVRFVNDF